MMNRLMMIVLAAVVSVSPLAAQEVVQGKADGEPGKDWRLGVQMVKNPQGGQVVVNVFDHSPASDLKMKKDDVICSIDDVVYDDPEDAKKHIMGLKKDEISLVVQSGDSFQEIRAKLVTKQVAIEKKILVTASGGEPRVEIRTVIENVPGAKEISRKAVSDPRKKK